MPKLEEVGIEVDLTDRVTRSGMHLKLGEKQLKLRHLHPNNEIATKLSGAHWSFGYNLKSKDVEFEYRTSIKPGELHIKQRIPNAQWELFPTPEFKLCTNPATWGKVKHEMAISYDLLTSKGRIEDVLEYNRFKLKIKADTLAKGAGAHVALSKKLDRKWAKSAGVDFSRKIGPVLTYGAEPSKQLSLETAVSLQRKELWASVDVAPSAGSKVRLTAEATFSKSDLLKPRVHLGARYEV